MHYDNMMIYQSVYVKGKTLNLLFTIHLRKREVSSSVLGGHTSKNLENKNDQGQAVTSSLSSPFAPPTFNM